MIKKATVIALTILCVGVSLAFPGLAQADDAAGTLYIYGKEGAGDFTNPVFGEKYPALAWEGNDTTGYDSAVEMALHMMTQDGAFDLYAISYASGGFHFLRDKGYCMEIDDPEISAQIGRMYPFLQDAVTKDGQISCPRAWTWRRLAAPRFPRPGPSRFRWKRGRAPWRT